MIMSRSDRMVAITTVVLAASLAPGCGAGSRTPGNTWIYSVGMEFVLIPAGSFRMGSEANEEGAFPDQTPAHDVSIRRPFLLGKYAVTVGQFGKFVSATGYRTDAERSGGGRIWNFAQERAEWKTDLSWTNPGFPQSDRDPVVAVSWNDARRFVEWLNEVEATRRYRLPTEAEREYATRAGTTTTFSTGNSLSSTEANIDGSHPWGGAAKGPFRKRTTRVGTFKPNAWGLYDMHGNVYEWCADAYHDTYEGAPTDGTAWVSGGDQSLRVVRGSSWMGPARDCRSAKRGGLPADFRNWIIGFRVACAVEQAP